MEVEGFPVLLNRKLEDTPKTLATDSMLERLGFADFFQVYK
ncbi:hypothetical protein WJL_1453 [Lactiplantibacillus plantarum WJL]|uniref:Uncharacterized protein n=1 Tax=Lactiplantibacillus plantarum WJL TaxID=1350466 RepID=A0A837PBE1_LACPN|nr:hypothetical protein WJL_1453 [Lactiplantibacillus plantarum WJL]